MNYRISSAVILTITLTAMSIVPAASTPKPTPVAKPSPTPTPTTSVRPTAPRTVGPVPIPSAAPTPVPPITQYAYGALKYVRANLGKKYVLGATGPNTFDCSGLMQAAWKAVGVTLPRISSQQFAATVRVTYEDLQPGDMVFFGPKGSQHVGIYIGNNKMIDAANSRRGVVISDLTLDWYVKNLAGYGRIPATDV